MLLHGSMMFPASAPPAEKGTASPASVESAYWSVPADRLLAELGSSVAGMDAAQVRTARSKFGPNALETVRRHSALRTFLAQFANPLVLVLLAASLIALLVGELQEATIIWAIVLASCILSFTQEHRASRAMERLRRSLARTASVLRGGSEIRIPVEEVVPGDILCVTAGDMIAADGIVLGATSLETGQAILTGEAFPAAKSPGISPEDSALADRTNVVFSGTSVRSGFGHVLAVRTGRRTEFARIAETLERGEEETEFAVGIRRFGYLMMQIMLVLIVIVLSANMLMHRPAIESLLFSLALAVGLTPELLPAIITVTLSHGAREMEVSGVIVRRLAAIENLGSMDVLCTDKTGTLTEGVIRLEGAFDAAGRPSREVMLWAALNAGMETGLPNPLDQAIRSSAGSRAAEVSSYAKVGEIPYDFARKSLSVVCRGCDGEADLMITKGAVGNVLRVCGTILDGERTRDLAAADQASIDARLVAWSKEGYRVLGVAIRRFAPRKEAYLRADENALTFVGFLLFADTPKTDSRAAVAALAAAGIRTKIISGDNRYAVQHLAGEVGLPHARLLSGPDILHMSDDALFARAHRTDIFCELDPNQKERIVRALRRRGHVVGYLGDGINDAPALMAADVGISVDGAVDVAREAADIVLLQKSLAVLRQGVEDGRRTFANTMKYIFITTSANFGNMISMAAASLALPFLPMLARQILLNNLLSDIPAVAIAGDDVDPELVDRPRRWDIAAVRRFMVTFGLISSFFDGVTFLFLLMLAHAHAPTFQTGWFVVSLITEVGTVLVVRTSRPAWRSRPGTVLAIASALVAGLAVAIVYLPFAGVFGFVPLRGTVVIGLLTIAMFYFAALEAAKILFYQSGKRKRHPARHGGRALP